jgi:hypothetical protein
MQNEELLLLATAPLALAQTDKPEGRLTAELTFASIDAGDKGYVHLGDMEQFRASVFAGMDYDEDRKLSFDEFAAWDPGFSTIAEDEGKSDALTTAKKVVFAFWDRNGDGLISEPEMRFAVNADFRRADLDGSSTLTEDEFIKGFAIIVAMRAALRPDL